MHKAQGLTVENAITVMSSNDRMLNTQSLAYVLASRALKASALDMVAEQPKAKVAEKVAEPEKAAVVQPKRCEKEPKVLEK